MDTGIQAVHTAIAEIVNGAEEATAKNIRPDLTKYGGNGDVTFIWGDEKKGLYHIGYRRGPEVVSNVIEAIIKGDVTRFVASAKTITLSYNGYDAFLSLDMHGKPKTWLLTGWKKNVPDAAGEPSSNPGATQIGLTFSRTDLGAGTLQLSSQSSDLSSPRSEHCENSLPFRIDACLYHSVSIGGLELEGNLFLAPVAGYTDRAFRTVCAELGANFSFTELVSAEALSRRPELYGLGGTGNREQGAGNREEKYSSFQDPLPTPHSPLPLEKGLVARGGGPYGVQLFGADPETLYRAAALLEPLRPDALDINAGCPVPKVVKTGAGAALMKDPLLLGRMIAAGVRASRDFLGGVPVTVKMRSGWDSSHINYRDCADAACGAGAAMVTLHPRTRGQGYGGRSDWACIADLTSRLPVPVTGSGDLYSPEDAERMLRETNCAAVMFARGAQGNPWIFPAARARLLGRPWQAPSPEERISLALRHLRLKAEDSGEKRACLEMRKQFCAYTRGLPNSGALRNRLVQAETIAAYQQMFREFGID